MFLCLCTKYFQMKWLKTTYLYIMFNSVVITVSEMAFYTDFPHQKTISGFQKHLGFTIGGTSSKDLPANTGDKRQRFNPCIGRIPWRAWQPTPVFLPEETHGRRRLVGYRPQRHKVGHDWSDWARTHQTHSKSCTIETTLGSQPPVRKRALYRF